MDEKRLYNVWRCMVGRCHNENWNNYFTKTYYRDKGISVCDDWRYDFENFKSWALKNGYEDHLSIDRIDADGNYDPSNCRWITYEENRMLGLERGRCKRGGRQKENTRKVGKFMVIEKIEKRLGRINFYVYKVIQTGLRKSEAMAIAKELNGKLPRWEHRYMARVTLNCKEGQLVQLEDTGQYLNNKNQGGRI